MTLGADCTDRFVSCAQASLEECTQQSYLRERCCATCAQFQLLKTPTNADWARTVAEERHADDSESGLTGTRSHAAPSALADDDADEVSITVAYPLDGAVVDWDEHGRIVRHICLLVQGTPLGSQLCVQIKAYPYDILGRANEYFCIGGRSRCPVHSD